MIEIRTIFLLVICATVGLGADSAKLRTLTGNTLEGDLAGITDKHIQWRGKDGRTTDVPLPEVLDVDLQSPAPAEPAASYLEVALNDGTLLHCSDFALKRSEATLKLLSGQEVKLPLAAVSYVLRDAQDAANHQDWLRRLSKQGQHDMVFVKKDGTGNALEGTLGVGDEKDPEAIEFTFGGTQRPVQLKKLHGLSFFRKAEVRDDPVLCKAYDVSKNLLVVSKIVPAKDGYSITTVSGVTIDFPLPKLARLDFSKGKLTYLSDLEPVKKVESANLGGLDHYRRDKNLDGGPLRLAGQVFPKGLALHAYSELVFDIGGDYKDFKAKLGMDDQVGGDGAVKVVVEGDNKELFSAEVSRKTKDALPVAVNVKNVKQLKIVVSSTGLFDLGAHVDIVDAKVSK